MKVTFLICIYNEGDVQEGCICEHVNYEKTVDINYFTNEGDSVFISDNGLDVVVNFTSFGIRKDVCDLTVVFLDMGLPVEDYLYVLTELEEAGFTKE